MSPRKDQNKTKPSQNKTKGSRLSAYIWGRTSIMLLQFSPFDKGIKIFLIMFRILRAFI